MTPERWAQVRAVFERAVLLDADARDAYLRAACVDDAALLQEVQSLLRFDARAGQDFLARPAVDFHQLIETDNRFQPGTRIGAYELIELIGRGGMGEIYRAARADGQYQALVAIKVVHRGADSELIAGRFRHERQILAGLDHPYIARLLDGGTSATGTPYLVMELVSGIQIDQYCDARQLTVTQRLRLFQRVCAAVQYAHQHLVIHRDIKPSNVLITENGEPKLLDFGISKLLDPASSAELTVLNALTPDYASPEQVKGEPITTATDVYSLGVMLYRLLTGRSPYLTKTGTAHALARAICETQPMRPSATTADAALAITSAQETIPSRLRRRLAGDLDQIILKAMRKEPAARYNSVEQLAEDIERHLTGLPVRAHQGSLTYRASKFLRRHTSTVVAAALILLTLLFGIGATWHQARIATQSAARADRRFNDVRQIATSFLFEFHDAIRPLAGSTPARELLVKRALQYLASLAQEAGQDASLRHELATAYIKVADVQGAPSSDSLGDFAGALHSIGVALTLLEALHRGDPRNGEVAIDLAHAYGASANLLDATGSLATALGNYRKGIALLADAGPGNARARREFGNLNVSYGEALRKSGELPAAIAAYQQAVSVHTDLVRQAPANTEFKRDQGIAYIHLAYGYQDAGRFRDALDSARRAKDILELLVSAHNSQSQRDLNVARSVMVDELRKLGDRKGAIATELEVIAADEQAARADPRDHLRRRDVYVDYFKLARLQLELGDTHQALLSARHCLELIQADDKASPGNAGTRDNLATIYFQLSQIQRTLGQLRGALDYALRARHVAELSARLTPANLSIRDDLSEDTMTVADLQLALGDERGAIDSYLQAAAINEAIVRTDPTQSDWQITLAQLYGRLGTLAARTRSAWPKDQFASRQARARSYLQRSVAIWKNLGKAHAIAAEYVDEAARTTKQLQALQTRAQATGTASPEEQVQ